MDSGGWQGFSKRKISRPFVYEIPEGAIEIAKTTTQRPPTCLMITSDDKLTTDIHDHWLKVCNSLLHGELSAVETYAQAIEKYAHSAAADELRRILSEHSLSANILSANVRDMGGEPEKNSSVWGLFATAVQAAANLCGPESAIESLIQGERAGQKNYQAALLDRNVLVECKEMIREKLMPPVLNHISCLEKLGQAM